MPTSRGDVMSPKGGGGALGTPKGHVGTSKGPGRRTSLEGSKMLPFPGLVARDHPPCAGDNVTLGDLRDLGVALPRTPGSAIDSPGIK